MIQTAIEECCEVPLATAPIAAPDDDTLALLAGLRLLAAEAQRHAALADLLVDWEHEAGPVDDDAVATMTDRFEL